MNDASQTVTIHYDEQALARGETPSRPDWIEVDGVRYAPPAGELEQAIGERDRALVENELLREAFTETQVVFEDSRIDFVDVRVPRRVWLRLRAWRAADRAGWRQGSRWQRFTLDELRRLSAGLSYLEQYEPVDTEGFVAELEREIERRSFEGAS